MRSTPRFPRKPWEIVEIHDFQLIFHESLSKSMESPGFSRFLKVLWEIWVSISSTPLKFCAGLERAVESLLEGRLRVHVFFRSRRNVVQALGASHRKAQGRATAPPRHRKMRGHTNARRQQISCLQHVPLQTSSGRSRHPPPRRSV